jgi:hypothetical protein
MRLMRGRMGWIGAVVVGVIASHAQAAVVICERKGKLKLRQEACTAKETAVAASELGVTGPQGPAGADGVDGDQGPAGGPGLSGVEIVMADGNVIINFTGVSSANATCPAGKKVLGGGVSMGFLVGSVSAQSVRQSLPFTMGPTEGWYGELEATVTDDWGARVYAVCATAAP